jgi:hypothetical protein
MKKFIENNNNERRLHNTIIFVRDIKSLRKSFTRIKYACGRINYILNIICHIFYFI